MTGARSILLLALTALLSISAHAQVARVMSLQGTSMLERGGQSPRILGLGDSLAERDTINVGRESNALLEFRDRTRITLRPNTIFRINAFSDNERAAMDVRLVKGGVRATTGDIAKREPTAVKFQTNTAVLGVRGTEFDARICEDDCSADQRYKPAAGSIAVAARAIEVSGQVTAVANRVPRELAAGGALLQEESIVTSADGTVVLAFRDGTRISLSPRSELAIQRFHYDERAQSGHVHLKLVAGHAHVYTGQLAKLGGDAFLFETAAGMLRPQGTGFSVGAEDLIVVHTWDGTVILQLGDQRVEIKKTDTVAVTIVDGKLQFLASPPPFVTDPKVPRPDGVQVDPATFGEAGAVERGLYVWVRDGAVVMDKDAQQLVIPAGGAALATGDKLAPLGTIPNFMRFDPTPRGNFTPRTTGFQLPVFRAPDGSTVGLCKP